MDKRITNWNFFTNYGHTLFVLAQHPDLTIREIASLVGITERRAQKIIQDLLVDDFIEVEKRGRNNTYKVNGKKHLRHPIEENCQISDLIDVISESKEAA